MRYINFAKKKLILHRIAKDCKTTYRCLRFRHHRDIKWLDYFLFWCKTH